MKTIKTTLLSVASLLILSACAIKLPFDFSSSEKGNSSPSNSSSNQSSINSSSSSGSSSSSSTPKEDMVIDNMYLNKQVIDLVVGKKESLIVNFSPESIDDEYKDGEWVTSDENIATVRYGVVTAVKAGECIVSYVTSKERHVANCTVYVYNSAGDIVHEYQKVTDADSIKRGDTLVFGCPEFGVVASLEDQGGYLHTTTATFSGDGNKLNSFGDDVASFYVGDGDDDSLVLIAQDNTYLSGKVSYNSTSISFLGSTKGQVNWIFEIPSGYSDIYCVNYDIVDDYWLMFNKISNSDIRMNLYDSNVTTLMKLPTIYRLTIVR